MSDIFMISQSADTEQALGNDRGSAAQVAADSLCLAATPTFAILALLTAFGDGEPEILCAKMQHASPLSGMILMYLLMSAFHSAPWLKLMGTIGGDCTERTSQCAQPMSAFGVKRTSHGHEPISGSDPKRT